MPTPWEIAQETLAQLIDELPALASLSAAERERAEAVLQRGVMRQLLRDIWEVDNYSGEARHALLKLIDREAMLTDPSGTLVVANDRTLHWREWYPGLSNDDETLGAVLDRLPGFTAEQVPALVRLFENPASPVALLGACTLEQHDAIHVLIGRGLVDQDEAFVIGFTAGAVDGITDVQLEAWRTGLASYVEPYLITGSDLLAFDLGAQAGKVSRASNIHEIDVAAHRDTPLGELREQLGIDPSILRDFYRLEQRVIPGTPASLRLPVVGD